MDSLVHDDVRLRAYIHNTPLPDLMAAAAARRDVAYGRLVSFSRKVFIPLTKLCRDVCHYCTFAQRLRKRPGKHIWMMGGAGLIASFLDAGEVDEFDINVIPTLIGDGIPLVAPRHRDIELQVLSVRTFADGVVRMRYAVGAPPAEVRYTKKSRARSSAG